LIFKRSLVLRYGNVRSWVKSWCRHGY